MNLKEWRDFKSLTLTEAAKILGVSQPSLSRIEAGVQWPKPRTIEKIVKNSGGRIAPLDLMAAAHGARPQ